MWEIQGDEFKFSKSVDIEAPVPIVYETAARVDRYDRFLTDVATARMDDNNVCRMVVRAGPLRVDVSTKVTLEQNKRIDFVMIDGPPLKRLAGTWIVEPGAAGVTKVTFKVNIIAGRAGKWLLKTASRYMERKGAALIDAFRNQILKQSQSG